MTQIKTKIPAELEPAAVGGMVTDSKYVKDRVKNKTQEEVNADTEERVSTLEESVGTGGSVDERIAVEKNRAEQAEGVLDGKVDTEKQRAEGVEGGLNTRLQTVEELATISVGGGDIGIGTAADFESDDPEDLAKVPTIGAVLGSMDSQPTAGSKNIVESGGVAEFASYKTYIPDGWVNKKFNQDVSSKHISLYVRKNRISGMLGVKAPDGYLVGLSANYQYVWTGTGWDGGGILYTKEISFVGIDFSAYAYIGFTIVSEENLDVDTSVGADVVFYKDTAYIIDENKKQQAVVKVDKAGYLYNKSLFGVEGVGEIICDYTSKKLYKVVQFESTSDFVVEFFADLSEELLYSILGHLCTYIEDLADLFQSQADGINIVGIGTMGNGQSGVTKAGDVYLNTNTQHLYVCTKFTSSTNFAQVSLGYPLAGGTYFYNGAICKYENQSFVPITSSNNPFYGKKLYVIGDSIPMGQSMSVPAGAVACYQPFPALIAKALGMTLTNYAIGGSTFAISPLILGGSEKAFGGFVTSWSATDKDTSKYYVLLTGSPSSSGVGNYGGTTYYHNGSDWVTSNIASRTPISERYKNMGNDADIVFVFCGTNDFQYNWTSIGSIADTEPNTFYGGVKVLCEGLLQKFYGKPIIFCTPIKRCQTQTTTSDTTAHNGGDYGTIDSQNTFNKTLKEYGDIIKEVCARYSIPVIDCYAEGGLNPQIASQALLFDTYKTHPTQAGHEKLAKYLSGKIQSLFGIISY